MHELGPGQLDHRMLASTLNLAAVIAPLCCSGGGNLKATVLNFALFANPKQVVVFFTKVWTLCRLLQMAGLKSG